MTTITDDTQLSETSETAFFWFRRDLRIDDNHGLYKALTSGKQVIPVFIFDTTILDALVDRTDRRVEFILQSLSILQEQLRAVGSTLIVEVGTPFDVWRKLAKQYTISEVYANHDYEPYAAERDGKIRHLFRGYGTQLRTFKDQVIFEKREILNGTGNPYGVFTPYSRAWKALFSHEDLPCYDTQAHVGSFWKSEPRPLPTLESLGFRQSGNSLFPEKILDTNIISHYDATRDFPALKGTTRLSVHLRFGTISIRQLCKVANTYNQTWLNELIWRDFYMMILANYPHVCTQSYHSAYDALEWRNNLDEFEQWQQGKTGYPLVDAGMRELNATGFMHNRVRMVVASFLTKHLLVDWRLGEQYFAQKLLDYDMAANNGGWQWAAGSGCDAAPYFRIFNPTSQMEKFDVSKDYVRTWVPEYGTDLYPVPIVEHTFARSRCLEMYKRVLAHSKK